MVIFSFLRNVAYSKFKCHGRIFYIYCNINLLLENILKSGLRKKSLLKQLIQLGEK